MNHYANNGAVIYLPTLRRLAQRAPELHTFQAWSDAGYKIVKGSKHVGRNPDGVCLFSALQVEKMPRSRFAYSHDHDPDAHDDESLDSGEDSGFDINDYGDRD